jgi:hypothetical protein
MMRKFYRVICAVLVIGSIAVFLGAMTKIGLDRQDEWYTSQQPTDANSTSDADLYRGWLAYNGMPLEEDTADDLAIAVCAAFDSGASVHDTMQAVQDGGGTVQESAVVVYGAVQFYCPEYLDTIDAFVNGPIGESI